MPIYRRLLSSPIQSSPKQSTQPSLHSIPSTGLHPPSTSHSIHHPSPTYPIPHPHTMDAQQNSSAIIGLSKRLLSTDQKDAIKKSTSPDLSYILYFITMLTIVFSIDGMIIGIFCVCVLLPLLLIFLWIRRKMMRRRMMREGQWYGQ